MTDPYWHSHRETAKFVHFFPRLLMLDEPSLGLAPVVTDGTIQKIQEIHSMAMAALLVEQNVSRALTLVQRADVLESGR